MSRVTVEFIRASNGKAFELPPYTVHLGRVVVNDEEFEIRSLDISQGENVTLDQ